MERITLNLIPKGITPICHASQYDTGRQIALDLMDDLQGYTLNDETIELGVCKPDGNIVTAAVEVTSGKTYVIIETTEQMTACEGDSECELKISKDGTVIGTLNFKLRVERDPLKDGIESETVIHNLESMVEEMVAEEVATQYDSGNVIFDPSPVQGHGNGYTVTSEGIGTALDTKQNLIASKSASGDLITITDGGDNIPLKSCEIEIAPDLTGHTEANLVVCGKNLCPYIETGAINQTTGEETPNNDLKRTGFIRVKPNIIYYLSHFTSVNANTRLFYYDKNKQYLRTEILTVFPNGQPKKMPIDTYYLRLQAYSYFYDYSNIQVEEGSTGSNYENYLGTTYNIPFGQTVYGGEGDVTTGEFISDMLHIDMGTLSWNYSSASNAFYAQLSGASSVVGGDTRALCEGYTIGNKYNTLNDGEFIVGDKAFSSANSYLIVRDDSFSGDSVSFKASVNGKYVVYTATTPTTLSLTPVTPKTISGVNNIYNDCGSTAIEYFPNTVDGFVTLIKDYNVTDATELPISDSNPTNTKAYIDSGLSGKADSSNVYPKTDVYTKTEVNNLLGWEYINTIVDNGATADISNYETIIALPLANGTNKYNPYTIWKSMLSGTISLTMFRSNSYYWTGTLTLTGDTLSVTNNELTGWTSVTVAIYGKKS